MTIRQLPGFAFRSAGDYAAAMADIHARYDPVFGRSVVDLMERLRQSLQGAGAGRKKSAGAKKTAARAKKKRAA